MDLKYILWKGRSDKGNHVLCSMLFADKFFEKSKTIFLLLISMLFCSKGCFHPYYKVIPLEQLNYQVI